MAIIIAALGLSACGHAGLKDYAENTIRAGATIEQMKIRYGIDLRDWDKPGYYLPNGNAVYIERILAGKNLTYIGCDNHWEVNPQGRVVGYLTVGPKCTWYRGRNDADPRLIEGATTQQK